MTNILAILSSKLDTLVNRGTAILLLLCCEPAFGSISDDLRFETSAFMKSTAYRRVDRLAADCAPSGAISPVNILWDQSHVGNWYIEEQRYGTDAILGGIAQQDTTAIERGLKILHWGFEQQQPDGSFQLPGCLSQHLFLCRSGSSRLPSSARQPIRGAICRGNGLAEAPHPRAALWMVQPSVESFGPQTQRSLYTSPLSRGRRRWAKPVCFAQARHLSKSRRNIFAKESACRTLPDLTLKKEAMIATTRLSGWSSPSGIMI